MSDKTLKYKDYYGSIECDLEEGIIHGKVLHVRDLVTYEADSIPNLKKEFEFAVDDYLETCKSLGKEPNKPYSGSFNVRIGPEWHRKLAIYAANQEKNLNKVVLEAIRAKLNPKVDHVHINHDHNHNIHHEHVVKLESSMSNTSEFNYESIQTETIWNDIQLNRFSEEQH